VVSDLPECLAAIDQSRVLAQECIGVATDWELSQQKEVFLKLIRETCPEFEEDQNLVFEIWDMYRPVSPAEAAVFSCEWDLNQINVVKGVRCLETLSFCRKTFHTIAKWQVSKNEWQIYVKKEKAKHKIQEVHACFEGLEVPVKYRTKTSRRGHEKFLSLKEYFDIELGITDENRPQHCWFLYRLMSVGQKPLNGDPSRMIFEQLMSDLSCPEVSKNALVEGFLSGGPTSALSVIDRIYVQKGTVLYRNSQKRVRRVVVWENAIAEWEQLKEREKDRRRKEKQRRKNQNEELQEESASEESEIEEPEIEDQANDDTTEEEISEESFSEDPGEKEKDSSHELVANMENLEEENDEKRAESDEEAVVSPFNIAVKQENQLNDSVIVKMEEDIVHAGASPTGSDVEGDWGNLDGGASPTFLEESSGTSTGGEEEGGATPTISECHDFEYAKVIFSTSEILDIRRQQEIQTLQAYSVAQFRDDLAQIVMENQERLEEVDLIELGECDSNKVCQAMRLCDPSYVPGIRIGRVWLNSRNLFVCEKIVDSNTFTFNWSKVLM